MAYIAEALAPYTEYPKHFSGEVIVTLKKGERLAHREQINRGAYDNPASDTGIVEKYMDNAQLAISRAHAETLRDQILNLDARQDSRTLASALAKEVRDFSSRIFKRQSVEFFYRVF